jgi:hypothetical protein
LALTQPDARGQLQHPTATQVPEEERAG